MSERPSIRVRWGDGMKKQFDHDPTLHCIHCGERSLYHCGETYDDGKFMAVDEFEIVGEGYVCSNCNSSFHIGPELTDCETVEPPNDFVSRVARAARASTDRVNGTKAPAKPTVRPEKIAEKHRRVRDGDGRPGED